MCSMVRVKNYETYDDGVSYELQSVEEINSPYGHAVTERRFYFCTAAEAEKALKSSGYWTEWFGFTPKLIAGRMYCILAEEDVEDNVYVSLYGGQTARRLFRAIK